MSQDAIQAENGSGLDVRTAINKGMVTIATLFSGAAEPSPTFPRMIWADEGNGLLKQRSYDNQSWIEVGKLDQTNWGLAPAGFGLGALTKRLANDASMDLNTCGFFSAYTTSGGGLPLDNYTFIPMPINADNKVIIAVGIGACSLYIVTKVGGTWGKWKKVTP